MAGVAQTDGPFYRGRERKTKEPARPLIAVVPRAGAAAAKRQRSRLSRPRRCFSQHDTGARIPSSYDHPPTLARQGLAQVACPAGSADVRRPDKTGGREPLGSRAEDRAAEVARPP